MSGFEIVGLVIGVIPFVVKGLKFYENDAQVLLHHKIVMNDLIVSLHTEHSRFRHSCSVLLRGLVEDKDLEGFLDKTTKEEWEEALSKGLETRLRERLGHRYHAYTETMRQIQEKLEKLGKVVGMGKQQQWYEKTEYENQKTWHKIKKCIKHSKHKQLLEDLEKYNTKLEQMTPGISLQAQTAPPQPKKADLSYWDSIRRAAMSLHCALCSGWLCCCVNSHVTHFQLEDRVTMTKGPHRFKLAFKMPETSGSGPSAHDTDWQNAEFEALEDDDLSTSLPRSPGGVAFASTGATSVNSRSVDKQIRDLCKELKQPSCGPDDHCIGFILQDEHKHFIHLPKRPLTVQKPRNTITLHHLLSKNGQLSTKYTFGSEVVDRYELALLLASSLLQLHATSWLGDWWSTEDILILPRSSRMTFRNCTFVMQTFPSTVVVRGSEYNHASTRQMVIRNEAIFRLGATLVELSTVATLEAQEEVEDHRITEELTDFNTAERLSKAVTLNNAPEWNAVVDRCLRCGFHSPPDFTKKDFRVEFYQCVVAPLEKLYRDSKLS
ncbi:hypothetical protein F53441_12734 [Fusarium austroafricanum]|uniref:DUF7580 domain-containing protein n=1 Tax=Fusarium austroafricanum TaxID=2364996 RepID=A0A8H4JX47_9HYPO|nr:hypothetical protein F53441_12734 [Fusarium austroafricanum]